MIEVIDNALPESIFKELSNTSVRNDFPWYFSIDISKSKIDGPEEINPGLCLNKNSISTYQLSHSLYDLDDEVKVKSSYFNLFNKPIIHFLENRNITGHLYRSKLNLLTNLHKIKDGNLHNIPHIDIDLPHFSILLYLNDSDGDTIFFNERSTGNKTRPKSVTIKERISPKRNRLVLSDGNFHTSTNPINTDYRIVYNTVILINE